jgi:uncharacterized protein (DUF2461 family)
MPDTAIFSPELFQFLRQLKRHNNREWFAKNKARYLEGDSLAKPPRGFDPDHLFIEDLKMKDFVTSIAFSEGQVCGQKFLRDFATACWKMFPLVEFTTRALGQTY